MLTGFVLGVVAGLIGAAVSGILFGKPVRRGLYLAMLCVAYRIDRLCGHYSHPSERRHVRRQFEALLRAWRIQDVRAGR